MTANETTSWSPECPRPAALGTDVVLADDDSSALASICYFLESEGIATATAHDGIEALDLIRVVQPRVAILDLNMPGMGGDVICKAVRTERALASTLLVLVSAMERRTAEPRAAAAGADFYLEKPFDPRELMRIVTAGLDRTAPQGTSSAVVGRRSRTSTH